MNDLLCWHRPRPNAKHLVCAFCGVLIEECPCVVWRVPYGDCTACDGSGWVAVVRGKGEKFAEYLASRD